MVVVGMAADGAGTAMEVAALGTVAAAAAAAGGRAACVGGAGGGCVGCVDGAGGDCAESACAESGCAESVGGAGGGCVGCGCAMLYRMSPSPAQSPRTWRTKFRRCTPPSLMPARDSPEKETSRSRCKTAI